MSKEHIRNLIQLSQAELKDKLRQLPEQELRELHQQSIDSGDCSIQVLLCRALLAYEERPGLAWNEIKNLENHLAARGQKATIPKF